MYAHSSFDACASIDVVCSCVAVSLVLAWSLDMRPNCYRASGISNVVSPSVIKHASTACMACGRARTAHPFNDTQCIVSRHRQQKPQRQQGKNQQFRQEQRDTSQPRSASPVGRKCPWGRLTAADLVAHWQFVATNNPTPCAYYVRNQITASVAAVGRPHSHTSIDKPPNLRHHPGLQVGPSVRSSRVIPYSGENSTARALHPASLRHRAPPA